MVLKFSKSIHKLTKYVFIFKAIFIEAKFRLEYLRLQGSLDITFDPFYDLLGIN